MCGCGVIQFCLHSDRCEFLPLLLCGLPLGLCINHCLLPSHQLINSLVDLVLLLTLLDFEAFHFGCLLLPLCRTFRHVPVQAFQISSAQRG